MTNQRLLLGITGSPGTDKTCLCNIFSARGFHPVRLESVCSGWRSATSPRRQEFDRVLEAHEIAPEDFLAKDGRFRNAFYGAAISNPTLLADLLALDIPGARQFAEGWQDGNGKKGTLLVWRHLSEIWDNIPLRHVFLFHFGDRARWYEQIRQRAQALRIQTALTDHALDAIFREMGLDYETMLLTVRTRMGRDYTLVDTSDREAAAQTISRVLDTLLQP